MNETQGRIVILLITVAIVLGSIAWYLQEQDQKREQCLENLSPYRMESMCD